MTNKNTKLTQILCLDVSTGADSSDDSYVSAGEDPMEAPVCEVPLRDTVSPAGADVLLKCVIAGTPPPEGGPRALLFKPEVTRTWSTVTLLWVYLFMAQQPPHTCSKRSNA